MTEFENLKMGEPSTNLTISTIHDSLLDKKNIRVDILRLDLIHPQISGNKWFKLKYNLHQAIENKATSILSFGGPYSNHLHALAYAGHLLNLTTIGIIRGEEVENPTLLDCKKWGMQLHFISRSEYRNKNETEFLNEIKNKFPLSFIIPEGGNNDLGRKGTREILSGISLEKYSHISCAVGTGATFAGIVETSLAENKVLGFSAIKNGVYIEEEIKNYSANTNWALIHEYHFGGFAKKTNALISFMHDFKKKHGIELDFIYTGKMMFGMYDMMQKNEINEGATILVIHTGGLQGNRS